MCVHCSWKNWQDKRKPVSSYNKVSIYLYLSDLLLMASGARNTRKSLKIPPGNARKCLELTRKSPPKAVIKHVVKDLPGRKQTRVGPRMVKFISRRRRTKKYRTHTPL